MENEQAFLADLADVLEVDADEVSRDFELTSENWDSGAVLSAIALIDEHFGVTVPAKELRECASVGALLDQVRDSLAQVAT